MNCQKNYKRERVICKACNSNHTTNSYNKHLKSKKNFESQPVLDIKGQICSKCNICKSINSFYNDKYKKDGKRSHCIECVKLSKMMNTSEEQLNRRLLMIPLSI